MGKIVLLSDVQISMYLTTDVTQLTQVQRLVNTDCCKDLYGDQYTLYFCCVTSIFLCIANNTLNY